MKINLTKISMALAITMIFAQPESVLAVHKKKERLERDAKRYSEMEMTARARTAIHTVRADDADK